MDRVTKKKKSEDLIRVGKSKVIATIKKELYTIIVTETHCLVKTVHYSYIIDNTCVTYPHWRGLADLHNEKKRSEEDEDMYQKLLILFTNSLNWHTLHFQYPELMRFMWDYHTEWLNNKVEEAMQAELQEDDPKAIKELEKIHEFEQAIKAMEYDEGASEKEEES